MYSRKCPEGITTLPDVMLNQLMRLKSDVMLNQLMRLKSDVEKTSALSVSFFTK